MGAAAAASAAWPPLLPPGLLRLAGKRCHSQLDTGSSFPGQEVRSPPAAGRGVEGELAALGQPTRVQEGRGLVLSRGSWGMGWRAVGAPIPGSTLLTLEPHQPLQAAQQVVDIRTAPWGPCSNRGLEPGRSAARGQQLGRGWLPGVPSCLIGVQEELRDEAQSKVLAPERQARVQQLQQGGQLREGYEMLHEGRSVLYGGKQQLCSSHPCVARAAVLPVLLKAQGQQGARIRGRAGRQHVAGPPPGLQVALPCLLWVLGSLLRRGALQQLTLVLQHFAELGPRLLSQVHLEVLLDDPEGSIPLHGQQVVRGQGCE
ncbi:hypothetical protein V8C86DRAFT_2582090 [Haematococcus lacustris]